MKNKVNTAAQTQNASKLVRNDLYHACDLSEWTFNTTTDLEGLTEHLGQDRAMEALKFGIGIKHEGYNLYALGSTGLGKNTTIKELLKEESKHLEAPCDWCYINNFEDSHKPLVLKLPKGLGRQLQQDMQQFVDDLLIAIPSAFENDEYQTEFQTIRDNYVRREDRALEEIAAKAERNNIIMLRTPTGWNIGPQKEGKALSSEEFDKLPKDDQLAVTQVVEEIQDDLKHMLLKIPAWQKESREQVKNLDREVTEMTVKHYAKDLKANYLALANVITFIDSSTLNIIDNVEQFRTYAEKHKSASQTPNKLPAEFIKYQVNILVDNSTTQGAPIIFEDNPTYQNLIGRIEHISQFGTLITNFSLIKGGALHQANGGFLVLDARKVLTSLYAWEGLKRTLRSQEVKIESLEQIFSLASATSLQPEAIPLNVKVLLTGSRLLYFLLKQYDPEFDLLFKVAADFSEVLDRDKENLPLYARMITTLQKQDHLLPLDQSALERVIEHCSRMAENAEKVSLHIGHLSDLLKESDYWAQQEKRDHIAREDVQKVVDSRLYRMGQIRERMQEAVLKGIYLVKTSGSEIAQVNGLSIIQLDDYAFGRPSRITATARLGNGKVIDIEREVELGGAIHSKGVMILGAYLGYRYAKEQPLALSASLVFEQSYGKIEGDSASAAELCALLSAIADIPIKQSLAITGSVNQHGEIQAIGGVNEKIEGFFDICNQRGLTGEQGVIIPASNTQHLMLNNDVLQAVDNNQFSVYSVENIDQVMSLLTGLDIGEQDQKGQYPAKSLNGIIAQKIQKFTALQEQFTKAKNNDKDK